MNYFLNFNIFLNLEFFYAVNPLASLSHANMFISILNIYTPVLVYVEY